MYSLLTLTLSNLLTGAVHLSHGRVQGLAKASQAFSPPARARRFWYYG